MTGIDQLFLRFCFSPSFPHKPREVVYVALAAARQALNTFSHLRSLLLVNQVVKIQFLPTAFPPLSALRSVKPDHRLLYCSLHIFDATVVAHS